MYKKQSTTKPGGVSTSDVISKNNRNLSDSGNRFGMEAVAVITVRRLQA